MGHVFGPRHLTKAVWSKDDRAINLYAGMGDEDAAPKVIKVADLLK